MHPGNCSKTGEVIPSGVKRIDNDATNEQEISTANNAHQESRTEERRPFLPARRQISKYRRSNASARTEFSITHGEAGRLFDQIMSIPPRYDHLLRPQPDHVINVENYWEEYLGTPEPSFDDVINLDSDEDEMDKFNLPVDTNSSVPLRSVAAVVRESELNWSKAITISDESVVPAAPIVAPEGPAATQFDEIIVLDVNPAAEASVSSVEESPGGSAGTADAGTASETLDEDEVSVIKTTRGVQPLVDYPHLRFQCGVHPFSTGTHTRSCPKCYCYVCDVLVDECLNWSKHCHATDSDSKWSLMRDHSRELRHLLKNEGEKPIQSLD